MKKQMLLLALLLAGLAMASPQAPHQTASANGDQNQYNLREDHSYGQDNGQGDENHSELRCYGPDGEECGPEL